MAKKLLIALLCAGLILTPLALIGAGTVHAAGSTEQAIANAKAKRNSVQEQLKAAQSARNKLAAEKKELSGDLAWLNSRSKAQQKLYDEKLAEKEEALEIMELALHDYEQAELNFSNKKIQYGERIHAMFSYQDKSLLELLLSSDSLQGFFSTIQMMKYISDADEQALVSLKQAEAAAKDAKEAADQAVEEMTKVVEEAEAALQKIKADVKATADDLAAINKKLAKADSETNAFLNDSRKIQAEIASLEKKRADEIAAAERARAEAARKANQPSGNVNRPSNTGNNTTVNTGRSGRLAWPVPSSGRITSSYGYRRLFGRTEFHLGIDIGASYGSKIVAADGGVVVSRGYKGSYGNFIMISHGNGLYTCYAHLSSYNVSNGQSVSRGQVIGYIGSTGRSTGPHLHFEVRSGNSTVNPMNYLR